MNDLTFDHDTRTRLSDRMRKALQGCNFSPRSIEDEIGVMLGILEGFASAIPLRMKLQPETQQRRKERIESIATHFEALIDQLTQLDSAALGYTVWRGFDEISQANGLPNEFPEGMDGIREAFLWRESNIVAMKNFALGLRKAAVDLPQHSANTSGKEFPWYAVPKELSAAMAIERLFWEKRLEFTVSNSGVAAECLRAIYQLGGLNIDRVDYWLKQARDHWDSMVSFRKRIQKRNEE